MGFLLTVGTEMGKEVRGCRIERLCNDRCCPYLGVLIVFVLFFRWVERRERCQNLGAGKLSRATLLFMPDG